MTAPMVAAGAVAKKWLRERMGITVRGCMTQMGTLVALMRLPVLKPTKRPKGSASTVCARTSPVTVLTRPIRRASHAATG